MTCIMQLSTKGVKSNLSKMPILPFSGTDYFYDTSRKFCNTAFPANAFYEALYVQPKSRL